MHAEVGNHEQLSLPFPRTSGYYVFRHATDTYEYYYGTPRITHGSFFTL